jgi:hypothetical protein
VDGGGVVNEHGDLHDSLMEMISTPFARYRHRHLHLASAEMIPLPLSGSKLLLRFDFG